MRALIADAEILTAAGCRITPVGADKVPPSGVQWGQRVHADIPTAEQIADMASDPRARGWAILCGNHDARRSVWDFEAAGFQRVPYTRALYDLAPDRAKYDSPNGGGHVAIEITDGPALRTEKLAYADTGDPDPEKRWELLAEIRGVSKDPDRSGAYAQVTGPGRPPLRPDFAPWRMTADEAEALLAPLRAVCERRAWKQEQAAKRPVRASSGQPTGTTTAEVIFESVADGSLDVLAVLPDGWTVVTPHQGRRINIGRPGGKSAISGNVLDGVYVIHSSAVTWAEPGEPMPAAQVLAESRHNGDHHAAMKAVEDAADGKPSPYAHWPASVLKAVADNRARQRQEYRDEQSAKLSAWEAKLRQPARTDLARSSEVAPAELDDTEDDTAPAAADASGEPAPNTWQRQALDDVLDGNYVPEQATLLLRDDGIGLLYRGRVHSIHAPSESFKSMMVQYEAALRLNAGESVLYLDFESDLASVTRRLLDLGADREAIRARFDYRHPEVAPAMGTDEGAEWAALLNGDYALVILDGVTEAMDVLAPRSNGQDINERIASWMRRYPSLLARRTGAAVALIDHVVKNEDTPSRHAIGGQHKMAGLDGAAYTVEVRDQPRRGHVGEIHLYIAKDRPGGIRPHCGPMRPNRTQLAAIVKVDSTGDGIIISLAAPTTEPPKFRPTHLMERVSRWMEAHPGQHARSAITDAVQGKKVALETAIDTLADEGYLAVESRQRGSITSRHYTFERLFTEADDTPPVLPVPDQSPTSPRTGPTYTDPIPVPPVPPLTRGTGGTGTGRGADETTTPTPATGPTSTSPPTASATEATPTCPACGREHGHASGVYCYRCWHLDPDLGQPKESA